MRKKVDTVIFPKWTLPIEPDGAIFHDSGVVIDAGVITAILPKDTVLERYDAKVTHELSSHVLMPGFVNAHAHSPMVLLRGIADDLSLMEWLSRHIWPLEKKWLSPEFVKDGTLLAIAEMIKGGTTCFAEHYFYPDVTASAVVQSGMRSNIGLWVGNIDNAWATSIQQCAENAHRAYAEYASSPLLSFCVAPHSPYQVNEAGWKIVKELMNCYGLHVHIHLQESLAEVENYLATYQKRPLAYLEDMGILDHPLQAVHMTQDLTEQDIKIMHKHHVSVVTCPESNLKLASGFCEVERLREAGINVAIGTDGAASNNDLDMLSEMRTTALLAKGVSNNPTAVNTRSALRMATLNGAQALGLGDKIGSIEIGKQADMIALDMQTLNCLPHHHIDSQIVYAAQSNQVSHVWVDGNLLLDDGHLSHIDESEVIERAQYWENKLQNAQHQVVE